VEGGELEATEGKPRIEPESPRRHGAMWIIRVVVVAVGLLLAGRASAVDMC
jgi:hypothetical protein